MGKRFAIILGVMALVLLGVGGWAAWTFRQAEQHLQFARADLESARSALESYDAEAAQESIASALQESEQAARLTDRLVWRGAAAVPKIGDSAAAAKSLVLAANSAILGLSGITDAVAGLDLESLSNDGRLNLDSLAVSGEAARENQAQLDAAKAYLAEAPTAATGGWVLRPIEDARVELSDAVAELADTAAALEKAGTLLPPAMGSEGPREYFIGVQAPNETRGTGGLLGTWAVVKADQGKLTVVDTGANEDLPDLSRMPAGLGEGYLARYRDDPTLVPNMNLSPDFPVAAQLWMDSYEKKTGRELDGALSLDVSAVGDLLTATGTVVALPDGGSLTGDQFASFLLSGIYDLFPSLSDTPARQAYQAQLGTQATQALIGLGNPEALIRAMVSQIGERRVAVWLRDEEANVALADTQLGHALQPAKPHSVEPVLINVGWSKLDTYIDRSFEYVVGRCPSAPSLVRSELKMSLRSDIPPGTVLPEYVVGTVPMGPDGPVNRVFLQVHLPPGADVVDVYLDGKLSESTPFEEAGRPAVGVLLNLRPRQDVDVRISFDEPGDGSQGQIQVQPMYRDAQVSVRERGC